MSIDSKAKGTKAETEVVKKLQEVTGLAWARSPLSGATNYCKGDVWLPPTTGKISKYCIEVKWYEGDQITCNLLNNTESQIEKWWAQTVREAGQMNAKPMLIFRKNRGKFVVGVDTKLEHNVNYLHLDKKDNSIFLYLLDDVLQYFDFI